jgi:hypothetical protein
MGAVLVSHPELAGTLAGHHQGARRTAERHSTAVGHPLRRGAAPDRRPRCRYDRQVIRLHVSRPTAEQLVRRLPTVLGREILAGQLPRAFRAGCRLCITSGGVISHDQCCAADAATSRSRRQHRSRGFNVIPRPSSCAPITTTSSNSRRTYLPYGDELRAADRSGDLRLLLVELVAVLNRPGYSFALELT